jgi:hypothetical protein
LRACQDLIKNFKIQKGIWFKKSSSQSQSLYPVRGIESSSSNEDKLNQPTNKTKANNSLDFATPNEKGSIEIHQKLTEQTSILEEQKTINNQAFSEELKNNNNKMEND